MGRVLLCLLMLVACGARAERLRLALDYGAHSFPAMSRTLAQAAPGARDARPGGYVDKLIDETLAPEEARAAAPAPEQPPGRRFFGADLGVLTRDHSTLGRTTEVGTRVRYRRETQGLGELLLEGELRSLGGPGAAAAAGAQPRSGERFTLYQAGYALTDRLRMDNVLGVQSSATNPLLSSSFRVFLPGSLVSGVSSTISGERGELRLQSGSLGRTVGAAAQQFDRVPGDLTGFGYTGRIGGEWSAGAQHWRLSGHASVPDHDSTALALQYQTPQRDFRMKGNFLRDSLGRHGLWLDGERRIGRTQHRFGAFRMQPGLLWTDAAVLNDQAGAYYRSDYLTTRLTLSGGAEATRNNLANDPLRAALRSVLAFGSGNWRIDQRRSAGGALRLRDERNVGGLPGTPPVFTSTWSVFGSQRFDFGASRLQLSGSDTRSSIAPARQRAITWNHDAAGASGFHLGTLLGIERETSSIASADRVRVGLTGRMPLPVPGFLSGSVSYIDTLRGNLAGEKSLNYNLFADWSLAPQWSVQLQMGRNRIEAAAGLLQSPLQETTLFVQLRYAAASGVPLASEGLRGAGLGAGAVRGRVFLDENNDGIWQATEKTAEGVPVFLDGRFMRMTDREGRFEFPLVPTGEHTVTVAVENLPLPWGLLDGAPRRVRVPLRGEAALDIPLQRLDR